jgi:hypothetical protein
MRHRKRVTLRLIVLGFAVAALGAPAAQAMPEGLTGPEARALQQAQQRAVRVSKDQVVYSHALKRRAHRAR